MKEITILSGKGGAGKTSITAALASFAHNAVFCDNDVDAADLHLIFQPEIKESVPFSSGALATINPDECTQCGLCEANCRFDAIHTNAAGYPEVNPQQCEGCRLCEHICPAHAISTKENFNNNWFVSDTRFGKMVHAKMGPGEENSGKLVSRIREKARELAQELSADLILSDGPPGIGCAAISSVSGTDMVLLVIEPTVSGLHDAKRLIELVSSFKLPMYAIINKFDIDETFTDEIIAFLATKNIETLCKIPFDPVVVEAMVHQQSIPEFAPTHAISTALKNSWIKISTYK